MFMLTFSLGFVRPCYLPDRAVLPSALLRVCSQSCLNLHSASSPTSSTSSEQPSPLRSQAPSNFPPTASTVILPAEVSFP